MNNWHDEKRSTRTNKPYKLVEYQHSWVDDFEELKAIIAPIYGDNLVSIEHIGSTSVPGMLAKPQIDACVTVSNIEKVKDIRADFEARGFAAKGDYVGQNEEYFTYDENGERKYNVHTLQLDNPAVEGYLSFRDYLRTHKDALEEYIKIKTDLRKKYGQDDYNSYDWNKGALITDLKNKALSWYRTAND